ncbi:MULTISPECIES: trypsin-like peptidase domain-containing protein [unclassified Modestobacter]
MTEQNRPADETASDRTATAGSSAGWPAPAPQGPATPQTTPAAGPGWQTQAAPATGWQATPAVDAGRQQTQQFAAPAGGHRPWPPAGWGAQQTTAQQTTAQHPMQQPVYGGLPPAFTPPAAARPAGRWKMGLAGLVAGALIGGGAGAGVVALTDDGRVATAGGSSAQSVTITDPERATTATAAAAKAAPSVVTLYVTSGSGSGSGSGVVLSEDGYVLTNNHVVALDGAGDVTVQVRTSDGTVYDATVVGTDPSSDLAVVQLRDAQGLTPATFADSAEVQVGDVAVAIGAPLGLTNTVTDGIISATNRAVQTGSTQDDSTVIDAIQTDAAINPGNSGGALVDAAGEVIGINTAIATVPSSGLPGQGSQSGNIGVGFAIPGNTAQRIAEQIIETGSASHALLGVTARTSASGNSPVGSGAELVDINPGSPAADAGLRSGDVITAVGNRAITTSTELTAAIRSAEPGDTVTLTVRRGSDLTEVDVTLDETS